MDMRTTVWLPPIDTYHVAENGGEKSNERKDSEIL
jgi:hypothetical protein